MNYHEESDQCPDEADDHDRLGVMPHRRTERPDRTLRIRLRAIVSAYGSADVLAAFTTWPPLLERFEEQLDLFPFIAGEEGPDSVSPRDAVPYRDAETKTLGWDTPAERLLELI